MKQERLRRETQEKYERSVCTPAGLKTFRLQPSIDNTSIMKVLFFLGVGGLLPHMGYIGMCGRRGYGVSAVLVINMVLQPSYGYDFKKKLRFHHYRKENQQNPFQSRLKPFTTYIYSNLTLVRSRGLFVTQV